MAKANGGKAAKAMTKAAMFNEIAEESGLKKTDVAKVFDALTAIITKQLSSKGPRMVTIPGLLKLKSKAVKAVKGGEKKINPMTKTEYVTKDKPATTKVTARALKGLKESLK
jgi:nucleoid DNA-binding protein